MPTTSPDCRVCQAQTAEGASLRKEIDSRLLGDSSRGIARLSLRKASDWLRSEHKLEVGHSLLGYHLNKHCDGGEPEDSAPESGRPASPASFSPPPSHAPRARHAAPGSGHKDIPSALQDDIALIDAIANESFALFKHLAEDLKAVTPRTIEAKAEDASSPPNPFEVIDRKKKRSGRSLPDVQLVEGMANIALRSIKLKQDLLTGKNKSQTNGLNVNGLLALVQTMGHPLKPLYGDRAIPMEVGADGIFNPEMMPTGMSDHGSEEEYDGGEFSAEDLLDQGDAAPGEDPGG